MLKHGLGLIIQSTVVERREKILDRFPLDADIWRKNVIANREHARNNLDVLTMQERWQ